MSHWKGGARLILAVSAIALVQACSLLPGKNGDAAGTAAEAIPLIGLELAGAEGEIDENIRAHLSVTRKPCTVSRAYTDALTARTREETLAALRALGYYSPQVSVEMDYTGACPLVRIDVTPGEPVLVSNVTIDIRGAAADDAGFRPALGELPLVVGESLNHQHYSTVKQRIESVALERGYLEGVFVRRQLKVDPANRRADVTLVFDSGTRYVFGELTVTQEPEFLDEALVRRFLKNVEGEPYTAGRISAYHHALSKGAYFDRIDVRPRLSAPVGTAIPVEISLTPSKQHKLTTGIGASTDEGIRGRVGYLNRRLNRYGHQFNTAINASFIEQRLTAAYSIPRAHPVDEWLSFQTGVKRRDVDSFRTIETQAVVSETKRRPFGWMETRFIELNREDYDVSGTNDTTIFLAPGLKWRRATADNDLFPTSGYSIEFEVKGAADAVLSDTSFFKSTLRLASVYSLPFASRLILRGQFGGLWVNEFDKLPPTERYFAGGDSSIRGYDIDSLGPVDASNDVLGGTSLAVINAEIDHYFTDQWGVAVFADTGNAFGGDGSSTGLQTGVGIGVRWRSPVGPIRVDFAHPLDDPNNDFRLHLRIGPEF